MSTKQSNHSSCPVCQSSNQTSFFAEEKMFGMGGSFEYLECGNCKSLRIASPPFNLQDYYPHSYYAFNASLVESKLKVTLKKIRSRFWDWGIPIWATNYYEWLKIAGIKKHHHIADIGCGDGQLLRQLKISGYQHLFGYDPFIGEEYHTDQLHIYQKHLNEIDQKFDLIMFHHSLEHMSNPAEVFRDIKPLLNPGAKVIIRVPVTDGSIWKEEKTNWFQLDAPRHLFIPSIKALKILGEQVGLKVKNITFDSLGNQFWGTELYKMGKTFHDSDIYSIFSKQKLKEFEKKAQVYNQLGIGDQAVIYYQS